MTVQEVVSKLEGRYDACNESFQNKHFNLTPAPKLTSTHARQDNERIHTERKDTQQ